MATLDACELSPTAGHGAARAEAPQPLVEEAENVLGRGYTVVEGVLGAAVCESLREHVSSATDKAWKAGRNELFGNIQEAENRWDLKLDLCEPVRGAFNQVMGRCGRIFTEVVGRNAKVVELAAITSDPGARAQAVHADTMHGVMRFLQSDIALPADFAAADSDEEEDDLGEIMRAVATETAVICTMLLALQDVAPDMGPTLVWPGTHTVEHHTTLWSTCQSKKLSVEDADRAFRVAHRPMTLRQGDAVIYDSRTMHCGGANMSRSSRRSVLCISVMGPGIRPEGTTWTMLPELRNRLPLSAFPLGAASGVGALPAEVEELTAPAEPEERLASDPADPKDEGAREAAGPEELGTPEDAGRPIPPLEEWPAVVQCVACGRWRPCAQHEAQALTQGDGERGFECCRLGFSCAQAQGYTLEEIDAMMA